jgi:hypothetical protein
MTESLVYVEPFVFSAKASTAFVFVTVQQIPARPPAISAIDVIPYSPPTRMTAGPYSFQK